MKTHVSSPVELSELVRTATFQAGSYIRDRAFTAVDFTWKYQDDPVTNLDREAEELIRNLFLTQDPTISIIGEEYGVLEQDGMFTLYIDPIDGTKSFTRREFKTSVSLAVGYKKGPVFASAVYDFMRDMLYFAGIDADPLLIVDSAGFHQTLPLVQPAYTKKFILCDEKSPSYPLLKSDPRISLYMPTGSVAMQMAQVAAGIYDGLILAPHRKNDVTDIADIAAGSHLMTATGVAILDEQFKPFDYLESYRGIIALRPEIADDVLALLHTHSDCVDVKEFAK